MNGSQAVPSEPGFWGAALLVLLLVCVGIFDFVALYSHGRILPISEVVQEWSARYPMVSVICGVVIGHLFFPTRPK